MDDDGPLPVGREDYVHKGFVDKRDKAVRQSRQSKQYHFPRDTIGTDGIRVDGGYGRVNIQPAHLSEREKRDRRCVALSKRRWRL